MLDTELTQCLTSLKERPGMDALADKRDIEVVYSGIKVPIKVATLVGEVAPTPVPKEWIADTSFAKLEIIGSTTNNDSEYADKQFGWATRGDLMGKYHAWG